MNAMNSGRGQFNDMVINDTACRVGFRRYGGEVQALVDYGLPSGHLDIVEPEAIGLRVIHCRHGRFSIEADAK